MALPLYPYQRGDQPFNSYAYPSGTRVYPPHYPQYMYENMPGVEKMWPGQFSGAGAAPPLQSQPRLQPVHQPSQYPNHQRQSGQARISPNPEEINQRDGGHEGMRQGGQNGHERRKGGKKKMKTSTKVARKIVRYLVT